MAIFEYRALDASGNPVSGTIFGGSLAAVAEDLAGRGLRVEQLSQTDLQPQPPVSASNPLTAPTTIPPMMEAPAPIREFPRQEHRPTPTSTSLGALSNQAPIKDLMFFFRQLATMQRAGIGLVQSLDTLANESQSAALSSAIRDIRQDVLMGKPITEGMRRHTHIFSPLAISLTKVGEDGGRLEASLTDVANYLERELELRNLYRRVTFYPKLLFIFVVFIPFLANGIIKLLGGSNGIETPFSSTIFWVLFFGVLIFLFWFYRFGLQNESTRYKYDQFLLAIPYVGTTFHQMSMARFGRAFGALYAGGIAIPNALRLAADSCGNDRLRSLIYPASKEIEDGTGITDALARTQAFSPIILDMTRTGEQTGNLDFMLSKVSEYYEDEANTRSIQTGHVVGVVCFLIMAIIIAYIVIKFWMNYASGYSGAIS